MENELAGEGSAVRVSDHAIIRYLERALNLNIGDIRREICSRDTEGSILTLGNGRYPIGDQLQIVVENNVVVTVVGFKDHNKQW